MSTGAGGRGTLAILLTLAKMERIPSFYPSYYFTLGALALKYALFRVLRAFLEGFMGFVWVCLFWRFLWLVRLLYACGVRRI